MSRTNNNRANNRRNRHVRWDRVIMALVVLGIFIGAIILIVHAIIPKKETAAIESTISDDSAYFKHAIAPDELAAQKYSCNLLSGTDISKHNGDIITDSDFVIVKATEGIGYIDPKFEENIKNGLANGQLCGVYHFARPDTNMPGVEAEHFIETVRPYLGQVMLVLDWEVEEEIDNTAWVAAWMWEVYQLTGIRPILYTSASVAQYYDWTGISSQFDLWVACYLDEDNAAIPNQEIPYDLSGWRTIIWQYSTAGDLDRNVSCLTTEEWQNRCLASTERAEGNDLLKAMSLIYAE